MRLMECVRIGSPLREWCGGFKMAALALEPKRADENATGWPRSRTTANYNYSVQPGTEQNRWLLRASAGQSYPDHGQGA